MRQYTDDMAGWMRQVERRLERLTAKGTGWTATVHPLTLATGWSNYGGLWQKPGWSKLPGGLIVLTGLVRYSGATVAKSTVALLPAGARPLGGLHFIAAGSFGSAGEKWALIQVQPDGTVDFRQLGNSTFSSVGWLTLDGVAFVAQQ